MFKVGDKIKVIDEECCLKLGQIYKVSRIHIGSIGEPNGVYVENHSSWWYFHRFEKVNETPIDYLDSYKNNEERYYV